MKSANKNHHCPTITNHIPFSHWCSILDSKIFTLPGLIFTWLSPFITLYLSTINLIKAQLLLTFHCCSIDWEVFVNFCVYGTLDWLGTKPFYVTDYFKHSYTTFAISSLLNFLRQQWCNKLTTVLTSSWFSLLLQWL